MEINMDIPQKLEIDLPYDPSRCKVPPLKLLVRGLPRIPQDNLSYSIFPGYPPELDGKIVLLKTPNALDT